jgi:hypothetical protein
MPKQIAVARMGQRKLEDQVKDGGTKLKMIEI